MPPGARGAVLAAGTAPQRWRSALAGAFEPPVRRARVKIVLASIVASVVALSTFTWWALEWSGVAVLETRTADGSLRSTHVWFAEPNGELWLEAGTPENSWYLDVQREPLVSFSAPHRSGQYIAQRVAEPWARDKVRSLFREKYGLRDRWVALLFDTSHSVAVQLVPPRDHGQE